MGDRCPIENSKKGSVPSSGEEVASGCPVDHSNMEKCPVDHKGANVSVSASNPLYNAAANDMAFDHSKQIGQKINLSVDRATSTIPKGDFTPDHQPKTAEKWVYPSEQQYFNAMKRKGYNPSERDIPAVLYIHNVVNEQGWSKVKEWEAYSGNPHPKLKRFMGKPTQLSPKARLLGYLGYSKPFDRHDWVVERSNGEEVRYVIDFYGGARQLPHGSNSNNKPVSIYLDVRPAADSVSAVVARLSFALRQRFQPFSLPKWCLMGSPFFQAVHNNTNNSENKGKSNDNSKK